MTLRTAKNWTWIVERHKSNYDGKSTKLLIRKGRRSHKDLIVLNENQEAVAMAIKLMRRIHLLHEINYISYIRTRFRHIYIGILEGKFE